MPDPSAPAIARVIAVVVAGGLPLDHTATDAAIETSVTRAPARGSAGRFSGIAVEGTQ
jgi:hypothetical protein